MQEFNESEIDEPRHFPERTQWWIVSVLLHGLGIALAAVASMSLNISEHDRPLVVMMTELISQDIKHPPEITGLPPTAALTPKEEPVDAQLLVSASDHQLADSTLAIADITQNTVHETKDDGAEPEKGIAEIGSNTDSATLDDIIGSTGIETAGKRDGWGGSQVEAFSEQGQGSNFSSSSSPGKRWLCCFRCRPHVSCFDSNVGMALRWLAYHQEADGSWDSKKYGSSVRADTAVTGLALLAFLAQGHSERNGEFRGNVSRAVAWLKSKQAADGMIWDTSDDAAPHRAKGYPCAIASLALIEAGGMSDVASTRSAAQKAVDYICNIHQSSDGINKRGWRYSAGSEGDLSVTGWFVMALKSARVCGYAVPPDSLEGAIEFLNSLEVKEPALADGSIPSRYKYMRGDDHAQNAHRLTAMGAVLQTFLGAKTDAVTPSYLWFVNKGGLPAYGANGEKVDLYYWYYGTLVSCQQSRVQPQLWSQWSAGMKSALVDHQCMAGDDHGSWSPVGEYSSEWGRVGQTALSTLCLETQYRYEILDQK